MEQLFIGTTAGVKPIDQEIIQKYDLHKGTQTPFTQCSIVGKRGDYPAIPFRDLDPLPSFEDIPRDGFLMTKSTVWRTGLSFQPQR